MSIGSFHVEQFYAPQVLNVYEQKPRYLFRPTTYY
jgi:hypothetical protein